ncbi:MULTISPECIES: DNA (cytosine-5-)-methyltransferase [Corynebacterium]|uniref:DNA (cytosine-5-)-methyltransferase n=1 Tax=Corynebacterium TaxID=1716 RepID=UPI001CEF9EAD|nr:MULTISPECIES: DNA (cytosine-5-)-methyltransferase [Corynebacterium]
MPAHDNTESALPFDMSTPSTSSQISDKRARLNMSTKELADAVGLPLNGHRMIRDWELGVSEPDATTFNRIMSFPERAPFPNNEQAPLKMIDLFAGIGGTRLGFHQTGEVKSVFTSEIDRFAAKTYTANFGEVPEGDITAIDEKEIPDHDILVGGFPCQAFSQAGLKRGFDDTRGTLFFDIARILKEKRPRAFLLENVKNLKSHDRGRTFRTITDTLDQLNYETHTFLFKARDFGVPQNRERIYIVGFNRDSVPNLDDFVAPEPSSLPTRVGDILESEVDDRFTISDRLWHGHQRRKHEHKAKGNGFGYSLFTPESPYTSTISARYYKDGSEILIEQKGKNPRKLTPREAARLQGFPEEFIIPVSNTQSYKQFGNSVAVPVINALAEQIVRVLLEDTSPNSR